MGIKESTLLVKGIDWYELYKNAYIKQQLSCQDIAKQVGLTSNTVHSWFKKNNFQLRKQGSKKQTLIRELILESRYEELYYWVGFIAADGSLEKGTTRIKIALSSKDKNQLDRWVSFLGIESPRFYYQQGLTKKGNIWEMCSISVHSEKLREFLDICGVVRQKSSKDINFLELIPNQYVLNFIIGYFDGDGSIMKSKSQNKEGYRYIATIAGPPLFIRSLHGYFEEKLGMCISLNTKREDSLNVLGFTSRSSLGWFSKAYLESGLGMLRKSLLMREAYEWSINI